MQPKVPFELPKPPSPSPATASAAASDDTTTTPLPINWKWIARDVFILCATTYWGGRLIGFTAHALTNGLVMNAMPLINTLSMALGFFIVAYMVRKHRARHLLIVAAFLWCLGSLPNVIRFFEGPTADLFLLWLASAPLILFAALLGGGLGALLFRPKKKHAL